MSGLFVISGEPSSANYLSSIVAALRRRGYNGRISAVAPSSLASSGVDVIADPNKFATVGIFEALINFRRYAELYKKTVAAIEKMSPGLVVLMDLPDFNLKVAARLKCMGIPCVYFIAPQVWAWRRSRVKIIRGLVDKVLVVFRFEEEFYRKSGVRCEYVGHPLVEIMGTYKPANLRGELGIGRGATVISLFPGSREAQFKSFAPLLCKVSDILGRAMARRGQTVRFIFSVSDNIGLDCGKFIGKRDIIVQKSRQYDIMGASDLVITRHGTTTLEALLIGVPMVTFYRINPVYAALVRSLIRFDVKYYSLPNLLAGREVVPELMQEDATPAKIARAALSALKDSAMMKDEFKKIRESLGEMKTSEKVADVFMKYI